MEKWTCFAVIHNYQDKIILVQDNDKPPPYFWKMPGGRRKNGEYYFAETMTRELNEELLNSGVRITTAIPVVKNRHQKPSPHMFLVFQGICDRKPEPGKEIRQVGEFKKDEVLELINKGMILSQHADALRTILTK